MTPVTSAAKPVLELDQVQVRYHQTTILEDISFRVAPGDYLGIVGPNGSGKTTLIKTILGLIPTSSGRVQLFATALERFHDWGRIGYLPQVSQGLQKGFPATVREVVALGLLSRKRFPKRLNRDDEQAIDAVLELLHITNLKARMVDRLSGGQQQRVFLARALVADPDLLILDEPTVALDPETRSRFYETVDGLNRDHGKTVLLITHDSGTIGEVATKLLYLDRKVIFFGDFEEFCHSQAMASHFGEHSQHVICHRH